MRILLSFLEITRWYLICLATLVLFFLLIWLFKKWAKSYFGGSPFSFLELWQSTYVIPGLNRPVKGVQLVILFCMYIYVTALLHIVLVKTFGFFADSVAAIFTKELLTPKENLYHTPKTVLSSSSSLGSQKSINFNIPKKSTAAVSASFWLYRIIPSFKFLHRFSSEQTRKGQNLSEQSRRNIQANFLKITPYQMPRSRCKIYKKSNKHRKNDKF